MLRGMRILTESRRVHSLASWVAALLWSVAALLWLRSATITVPTDLQSGYGQLVGVEEMSAGFENQAFWNKWSAAASFLAAIVQALALATSRRG